MRWVKDTIFNSRDYFLLVKPHVRFSEADNFTSRASLLSIMFNDLLLQNTITDYHDIFDDHSRDYVKLLDSSFKFVTFKDYAYAI